MKRILFFFAATLFYSTQSFAIFCPESLNQITIGDTVDQVILQCGAPASQKTYKSAKNEPQEWNYYVKQPLQVPTAGSLRMTIAFQNGKVINISVNGAGITNTTICGKPITLNYTQKQITDICGKPVFITQGSTQQGVEGGPPKPDEIIEFHYTGSTPMVLIFENGKLKEQK